RAPGVFFERRRRHALRSRSRPSPLEERPPVVDRLHGPSARLEEGADPPLARSGGRRRGAPPPRRDPRAMGRVERRLAVAALRASVVRRAPPARAVADPVGMRGGPTSTSPARYLPARKQTVYTRVASSGDDAR